MVWMTCGRVRSYAVILPTTVAITKVVVELTQQHPEYFCCGGLCVAIMSVDSACNHPVCPNERRGI